MRSMNEAPERQSWLVPALLAVSVGLNALFIAHSMGAGSSHSPADAATVCTTVNAFQSTTSMSHSQPGLVVHDDGIGH
ncbi:MAG: hypothetical protein AAGJ56_02825 [Myxococcota bacterium]